jgi:hypothetical protein
MLDPFAQQHMNDWNPLLSVCIYGKWYELAYVISPYPVYPKWPSLHILLQTMVHVQIIYATNIGINLS